MSSQDKGNRYLGQLDEALCQGNWSDVTELARKVEKHTPDRKYFTLTARTEAQVASVTRRPNTASTTSSSLPDASEAVTELTTAIHDTNAIAVDDVFCAKVCLAGIHWIRHDYTAALDALPADLLSHGNDTQNPTLGWLEVCVVKGAFIRASALERSGREEEAGKSYTLAAAKVPGSRSAELRRWTERLLAAGCMFKFTRATEKTPQTLSDTLHVFRSWLEFWQRTQPAPTFTGSVTSNRIDNPLRTVWQSYYNHLSTILQTGLTYGKRDQLGPDLLQPSASAATKSWSIDAKARQLEEFKQVQLIYESLLMNETQFPKANEHNLEVEEWVENAVSNWKVLTGPTWTLQELGPDGRDGISRALLEILYRAANKTFHSTAILRYLFHVHTSLGEYDLALHAFRSYEDIVEKGKARALKTGERELGFDDDDTILLTAAEAIRVLCRYGEFEQAERATKVGKIIEHWLARGQSDLTIGLDGQSLVDELHNHQTEQKPSLHSTTIAVGYRAVGISLANWARWTYEADSRGSLQKKAIAHLRRADSIEPGDLDTSFALAKVLAETRDLTSAIEVLRNCISDASVQDDETETDGEDDRARRLMPLWHLLSLCLTAKEDYEPAMKFCSAAFDQFESPTVLFGSPQQDGSDDRSSTNRGLIDTMDGLEKETLMQIKLTQLAFLEITDSADAAVSKADEILSLYTQLFGRLERARPSDQPPKNATSALPSRGAGTLRSVTGSMRIKSVRHSIEKDELSKPAAQPDLSNYKLNDSKLTSPLSNAKSNENIAPSAKVPTRNHLHIPFRTRGHHGGTQSSIAEKDLQNGEKPHDAAKTQPSVGSPTNTGPTSPRRTTGPRQPLPEMEHNLSPSQLPAPSGHADQPPEQDVRLPAPHPAFSVHVEDASPIRPHDRQHNVSLLTKIWLFVADLYIKADHFDDAAGAVEEAARVVEAYEIERAAQHAGARSFALKGWGGGESIEALHAHVFSVKGDLAIAQNMPYKALEHYEQALSHFPDHGSSITGLSGLLMDIYEEKLAAEEPVPLTNASSSLASELMSAAPQTSAYLPRQGIDKSSYVTLIAGRQLLGGSKDPTPNELNRLAARDRAYMLLSTLTKLGHGWDNAEAWFKLARAYELGKEIDKAKQALWWVVELESHRPIRPWSEVAAGGYTL